MRREASGASRETPAEARGEGTGRASTVLVVGDDLMWSTRLLSQAARAGAFGRAVRDLTAMRAAVAEEHPDLVVVDLSGRFAGVDAVGEAANAGLPVIAIAQHEAHELRRRALAAGARRVYANAKMHADGVDLLRRWLDRPADRGAQAASTTAAQR